MTGTHAADPIHPAPRTPAPESPATKLSPFRSWARNNLPLWLRSMFGAVHDFVLRPGGGHKAPRKKRAGNHHAGRAGR